LYKKYFISKQKVNDYCFLIFSSIEYFSIGVKVQDSHPLT